jgi:GAF domain-containing protein
MSRFGSGNGDDVDGALPAEQEAADELDMQASLAGLSRLVTGGLTLSDVLVRVAQFAVDAIPGAEGAGVTLLEKDRADTVVASAPFVREVDAIQYGLGEGPCITAVAERRTVSSGSLGAEPTWPRFGPEVERLGVHSVLSLPLLIPDRAIGAMNVYAHAGDAFSDHAARLGELFAGPAAVSVYNAQVLAQTRRLATNLHTALTTRAIIDQAIGIMMSRNGGTPEEALDRLRTFSQQWNRELLDVAQRIVTAAVRRAEGPDR